MDAIFTTKSLLDFYMHYLHDYHARISLPIFTDFYLVKIQARISLPKRMNLRSVVPKNSSFLFQSLTITGFNVYKYANDFYDSLDELSSMCTNGKIKPHENVVEGFENMPKALIDQLDGKSQGKTILRV